MSTSSATIRNPLLFPEILRREREKLNLAPEDVALGIQVPVHRLRLWEAGERAPRFFTALRWASYLGFELAIQRSADHG